MFSKSLKRKIAVLLTGVMVFGMTVTAAAAPSTTQTGNGQASGDGAFEGHVNRKIVSVTLPTVTNETFAFIMDSEGLIDETRTSDVWKNYSIPSPTTNVYFKTGDKVLSNTSNKLTVSNNSSVSINVALKVQVKEAGSVKLVSSNEALGKEKDPALYLGLKIDDKAPLAAMSAGAEKTVSVNGSKDNYQVSANEVNGVRTYTFVQKPGVLTWEKLEFALEGGANEVDSAKGATAPKLDITWNYEAAEWEDDGTTPSGGGDTPAPTPKAGTASVLPYLEDQWLALHGENDAEFDAEATSLIVNTKDVTAKAQLIAGYVAVSATDLVNAGVTVAEGVELKATYVVNGATYEASYTP